MEIKNKSILKLADGNDYLVQKTKEIEGKNVFLLQELEEGDFFFGSTLFDNLGNLHFTLGNSARFI